MTIDLYIGSAKGIWTKTTAASTPLIGLSSVTAQDHKTVRAVFDVNLDFTDGEALHPLNYTITLAGAPVYVFEVQKVNDTTVDIITETLKAQAYNLLVENVRSSNGAALNPAADESPFTGIALDYGPTPAFLETILGGFAGIGVNQEQSSWAVSVAVNNVVMTDIDTIRINFTVAMDVDSELQNIANYSLAALAGGVDAQFVGSVSHDTGGTTAWVEIDVNRELTISQYQVTIASGKLQSAGNFLVGPDDNKASFTATGIKPKVSSARPLGKRLVEVTFSEAMDGTLDLTDPSSYTLSGGLSVLQVDRTAAAKVVLTLDGDMVPDQSYTITVTG